MTLDSTGINTVKYRNRSCRLPNIWKDSVTKRQIVNVHDNWRRSYRTALQLESRDRITSTGGFAFKFLNCNADYIFSGSSYWLHGGSIDKVFSKQIRHDFWWYVNTIMVLIHILLQASFLLCFACLRAHFGSVLILSDMNFRQQRLSRADNSFTRERHKLWFPCWWERPTFFLAV